MDDLRVDADQAYNTSHSVGNDAEELRDELAALQRDWDNLSHGWTGVASSAYSAIWAEWTEGATTSTKTGNQPSTESLSVPFLPNSMRLG